MFLRCLDGAFGRIREFPEMAPVFHGAYRRMLVPGFPHGVFYVAEGGRIFIAGIMDLRQEPKLILRRLRGRDFPE